MTQTDKAPGGERERVVEGESVALMRPFWVSWWGEPGTFELHRPWWVSGERDDGKQSICAAVLANDEFTARLSVQWAHDEKDAVIEWRFCEERERGWSPFGDRFRRADWMRWPDADAILAALREGDGWRPIETAPKDGTPVLTYEAPNISVERFENGGWFGTEVGTCQGMTTPTHWRPLPAPPASQGE